MSEQRVDAKAGWCGFCRSGEHGMCASVKCTCPSAGRRNHALRRSNPIRHEEIAVPTPLRAAPKASREPDIELVWEEPPTHPRRVNTEVRFAPLLEQVQEQPGKWARLATWPGKSAAGTAAKTLRAKGPTGYEYKATIRDGRSALYARFIGDPSTGKTSA